MSMSSPVAVASVVEPQTQSYQRVPYDLPAIGIWLPTTKNDACAGKEVFQAVADNEASASWLMRVVTACRNAFLAINRPNSSKVSPTSDSMKSAKNSCVQLTALEKQYLDYLKRSVGTGQFSHYLLPAP